MSEKNPDSINDTDDTDDTDEIVDTDSNDAAEVRRQRKIRALAKRKRIDEEEREEFDEAVEVAKIRTKLTPALFVIVFIASFVISGRSGWMTAWPEAFLRSFVSFGLTTWITIAIVAFILAARFALPGWLRSAKNYSQRKSMTAAIVSSTLALMVGIGVVVPASAWFDARGILPSVNFGRCVDSLRGSAAVVLNKKDDGSQYATVASAKNGIQRYALEPKGNGWKVTNMYTNKEVSNLDGC